MSWTVKLIKSNRNSTCWPHKDFKSAYNRALSLAELHGTQHKIDRNTGVIWIDATSYYAPKHRKENQNASEQN